MASNVYEGMFLLDSNRYSRDASGVSKQITDLIEKSDGEVLVSRLWSEQRLAYPIEGHRKGTYWLTYFRMDSERQPELIRGCKLNDNILRQLILKVDDRLVSALVSHAQDGSSAKEGGAAKEGAAASEGSATKDGGEAPAATTAE